MFAVVETGGKQYKVAEKDKLTVERLPGEAGDPVTLDRVLLVNDDGKVSVGAPTVEGIVVNATIVEQTRGDKIIVFKKKRRQNYRRKKGHRQHLTVLEILGIGKPAATAKKAAAPVKSEAAPAAEKPAAEDKPAPAKKAAPTKKAQATDKPAAPAKKAAAPKTAAATKKPAAKKPVAKSADKE